MQVRDIMTPGVEVIKPDNTVQEAAVRMQKLDIGILPVCDKDRLVGMVTDRDITVRATAGGNNPLMAKVADVMTPSVVFCFDDEDVSDAARQMKEKQIRRIPVLNRDKRLVGIVSLGDLVVDTGDQELGGNTLQAISEPAEPRR